MLKEILVCVHLCVLPHNVELGYMVTKEHSFQHLKQPYKRKLRNEHKTSVNHPNGRDPLGHQDGRIIL